MNIDSAYKILKDAIENHQNSTVRTIDGYYTFNFTNDGAKIEYMKDILIIETKDSMTYINPEPIVSIQVVK